MHLQMREAREAGNRSAYVLQSGLASYADIALLDTGERSLLRMVNSAYLAIFPDTPGIAMRRGSILCVLFFCSSESQINTRIQIEDLVETRIQL